MALILNIETSGTRCSVALAADGGLLKCLEQDRANSHSSILTPFIEQILKDCGRELANLDAIAFSEGPGSYTGLRIGLATAKGLCYALEIPLIAISTLKSMAWGAAQKHEDKHPETGLLYAPMIDARRMEVYTALYDGENEEVQPPNALIVEGNPFTNLLEAKPILFFGDGAEKCRELLNHKQAIFEISAKPSAADMAELSHKAFITNTFADLAYYQPNYLKPFYTPAKKVRN